MASFDQSAHQVQDLEKHDTQDNDFSHPEEQTTASSVPSLLGFARMVILLLFDLGRTKEQELTATYFV